MSRISAKRLAFSCLGFCLLVAAAELLLRACGPDRYGPKGPITWDLGAGPTGEALNDRSRGLWRPKPGAVDPWGELIGANGCRGPAPSTGANRVLILALGDSSTYGYGLPEAQSWPRRLEALLRERGIDADVLNGGVIGYTVVQGRTRFEELAPEFRPQLVVLAFGAFNDHLAAPGGVDDRRRVALWGSRNALSERLRRESAVVQAAAELAGLAAGSSGPDEALQQRRDLWGDIDYQGTRRAGLREFAAELGMLCVEVREAGALPLLVSMPRRLDLEVRKPVLALYSAAVERAAKNGGFAFVDARAGMATQAEEECFLHGDHVHPSAAGHALIAGMLADAVQVALGVR